MGSSGALHEFDIRAIPVGRAFIGICRRCGVYREGTVINSDSAGAIGNKISRADKVIVEDMVMMLFVDGNGMLMANLHAQLRAGKEAEGQVFVYPVPFLERNGADGFGYNLVQCSVLGVTQELAA
jgi:hypothetical protein